MRFIRCPVFVVAAVLLGGSASAQQGLPIGNTVNDSENSLFINTNYSSDSLSTILQNDSGSGRHKNDLTYSLLTVSSLAAAAFLFHGGANSSGNAAVIRDTPQTGGTNLNNITNQGPGSGGNNGTTVIPTPGQPGTVSGTGDPVTYHTSDVPEPGVFGLLLGSGIPGLIFGFKRFRRS